MRSSHRSSRRRRGECVVVVAVLLLASFPLCCFSTADDVEDGDIDGNMVGDEECFSDGDGGDQDCDATGDKGGGAKDVETDPELVNSGYMDEALNSLDQGDPALAAAVRDKFLFPPAPAHVPYNFSKKSGPDMRGQFGQTEVLEEIYSGRWPEDGFFVEAGAYDGEYISNSLLFEVKYGWKGILVEPNPDVFVELQSKNRKAWTVNNCLSTSRTPEFVEFDAFGLWGGIVNQERRDRVRPADMATRGQAKMKPGMTMLHYPEKGLRRMALRVQCLPLYSLLAALGNPTVHYLVLDIEGAEMSVLRSIPWEKVDIKVVQIEVFYLSKYGGVIFEGSRRQMHRLMEKAGYAAYKFADHDVIYVKRDFLRGPPPDTIELRQLSQ